MKPRKATFGRNLPDDVLDVVISRLKAIDAQGWTTIIHNLPVDLRWKRYGIHLAEPTILSISNQRTAARLFDHPYRMKHRRSGAVVHVGEPYANELPSEREIKALVGDQYNYKVLPEWSVHNPVPGVGTIAVWVYEHNVAELVEALLKGGKQ
jgi:hypothetical protein